MPVESAYILVGLGGLCLLAGLFNWKWYLEGTKLDVFNAILGRKGARGVALVLGATAIAIGALRLSGHLFMPR